MEKIKYSIALFFWGVLAFLKERQRIIGFNNIYVGLFLIICIPVILFSYFISNVIARICWLIFYF